MGASILGLLGIIDAVIDIIIVIGVVAVILIVLVLDLFPGRNAVVKLRMVRMALLEVLNILQVLSKDLVVESLSSGIPDGVQDDLSSLLELSECELGIRDYRATDSLLISLSEQESSSSLTCVGPVCGNIGEPGETLVESLSSWAHLHLTVY